MRSSTRMRREKESMGARKFRVGFGESSKARAITVADDTNLGSNVDRELSDYLDAEELVDRGLECPGCGAAWHPSPRRTTMELRHRLECPFRQAFNYGHLGRLVGELLTAIQGYDDSMSDPITSHYGMGSEMSPLFWSSVLRKVKEILSRYDMTLNQVLHLVDERCGERWTYMSGLDAEELERV